MADAGDNQQEAERRSDETESRSIKEPKEKEDEDENPQDQIQSKERMRQSSPYPVRPGKKDCQFYLKNGLCRYRSSCRFNHPTQLPQELPVRICKHIMDRNVAEPMYQDWRESESERRFDERTQRTFGDERTQRRYGIEYSGARPEKRSKIVPDFQMRDPRHHDTEWRFERERMERIERQRREAEENLQEQRQRDSIERQRREAEENLQEQRQRDSIERQRREAEENLQEQRQRDSIERQRREAEENLQEQRQRDMPENHNVDDQQNLQEQRRISIEKERTEARLRLEQIRPTVSFPINEFIRAVVLLRELIENWDDKAWKK
ncbi:Zinc finger CCCH-type [Arabidopsis thaliana x Arabidopsis arenosa]|uniref:Zinc finger CCCH-type n=2 Tax=Arabidopsis TaxID=3701 RepID=A0A8T2H8S1_ARASU|nr:Zinc finger CCCH-type [Arabidopsis thaliana x Arabidopsis arenosa]KAG7655866.1 Zinc finger CCCH-type [Arabidopsis suecica]